jgi:hypothetical protein
MSEEYIPTTGPNTLEGLRGWLILVGIGIVFTPLRLLSTYKETSEIFSKGYWAALTTSGTEAYTPFFGTFFVSEIIVNIVQLVLWIYIAYLFFSKKSRFPKWYIAMGLFGLTVMVADTIAVKFIFPDEPAIDPDTIKGFGRSLIFVFIWIPYMLYSKRVKATFVR